MEWKILLLYVSRAQGLDDKDVEILYHLSINLALSKQVNPHAFFISNAFFNPTSVLLNFYRLHLNTLALLLIF